MKPQAVNETQHTATPTAPQVHVGFHVNTRGPVVERLFDLLYSHQDIRVVDIDQGGAFLAPETAIDLADLIATDEQLAELIRVRETSPQMLREPTSRGGAA
jgi:hypothetical protein